MLRKMTVWFVIVMLFSMCAFGLQTNQHAFAFDNPESEKLIIPPVQLFDMQQERIIKTFKNDDFFQNAAKEWLMGVTGMSPQLTIGSNMGYIVRVPLMAPYTVKLNNHSFETRDVFLVYVPNRTPLLLLFSAERKTYLLETKANVGPFMQRMLEPTGPGANRE
ncbi:type IV secretion system protein VirB6 [Paenibacillus marinisediminis]